MTRISRRAFNVTVLGAAGATTRSMAMASVSVRGPVPTTLQSQGVSDGLADLTLADASARIAAGRATSVDLGDRVPRAHRRLQPEGQRLHHRHCASRRSRRRRRSTPSSAPARLRGPLHGIPIALKDNIDTAGIRTTAASAVFDDRVPTEDAEVARRLDGGRRHRHRQGQPPRVRDRRHVRDELLRAGAQSVGARAQSRRIVGRLGGRGRGRALLRRARHRHRRVDPHAGVVLQRRRPRSRPMAWCRSAASSR